MFELNQRKMDKNKIVAAGLLVLSFLFDVFFNQYIGAAALLLLAIPHTFSHHRDVPLLYSEGALAGSIHKTYGHSRK